MAASTNAVFEPSAGFFPKSMRNLYRHFALLLPARLGPKGVSNE